MSNQSESERQVLLDATATGVCGMDREGMVVFCNEALLALSGLAREEIIGRNMHDVLHARGPDGTQPPRQECAVHNAIVRGEPVQINSNMSRGKDGKSIPVEYSGRPLSEPAGGAWYVATIKDLREIESAKDALRLSEEKYRRILESLPDIAWTSDVDGRTLYISPKVTMLLGFTNQEIYAGGTFLRLNQIHPEDFGRVNRAYRALFEQQVGFDEEYRIRRKDGEWVWVHDRATRTHIDKGVLRADGFMSDITGRKQAEAELLSKTAFLEAQANSTIDGLLVVDSSGRRLLANERFFEMWQIPPDLRNEGDDELLLEHAVKLVKDPESFRSKLAHLYRNPSETCRDELEFNDGTILDRYSAPVIDKNGTYYGRIFNFRDITEPKQIEEKLKELSLVVEQSPVTVVITDPKGMITYVNRKFTECSGYSPEEVMGKLPRVANQGQSPPEVFDNLWATITQGKIWRGELCYKRKNGEIYWEAATITPLTNPKGEITHFVSLKEDITERRVLETQLRHAQKMEGIGQLAAGIAHEINTPTQFVMDNLTFLGDAVKSVDSLLEQYRAAVESLADTGSEMVMRLKEAERSCDLVFMREEVPRAIDQSLEGAKRVAKIVRAMKEFSHPDSAEKTATDLNRAIESTITVARNEWKYVSDVTTEFDPQLPAVVCYPGDINQVVLNLIVNAAHTIKEKVKDKEKGRITVRTRLIENFAEISVSDSGAGIPEAIRGRVFDPFFTTKEVGKGTGQGLALAYTVVVKKHGGKIWFETEMGKGTTFFIWLPLMVAASAKGGA